MPSTAALDLAVRLDDQASKGMDSLAKKGGGLGSMLGGLVNPLSLATAGVALLGVGLFKAVEAAAEEEAAIGRMNQSLKANIPNWDGNTAAIEAYVSTQEKLAFSDDQIRSSLTQLVANTHDLTLAQQAQSAAMDLARFKNIDLEAATNLVGKAMEGSTGKLKAMGIEVKKGASATETLAAIQKVAGGQAQTFANSAAGAGDRIKNSFGNALESIGAVLLPKVSLAMAGFAEFMESPGFQGAITFVADLLSGSLARGFQVVGDVIAFVTPIIQPIIAAFQQFFGALQAGGDPLQSIGTLLQTVGTYLAELGGKALQAIGDALPGIIAKLGEWGLAFINWIGPQIPPMLAKLGELTGQLWTWLTGTALPTIIQKLGEWGKAFWEWVSPQIMPLLGKLGELLMQLGGWLIGTALPAIVSKLLEWGGAFLAWIGPRIGPMLIELGKLLGSIGGWLLNTALPAIVSKLGEWGAAFLGWVGKDVLPFIGAKLGELAQAIWNWITNTAKDVVNKVKAIGTGIIDGIKQGIADAWDAFVAWLSKLVKDNLPQWLKDWLGIASPSKVMAGIGLAMMQGWRQGILQGIPMVHGALQGAMRNLPSGGVPSGGFTASTVGLPSGARSAGATTMGGITLNVYAGIGADGKKIGHDVLEMLSHELGLHTRSVSHRGMGRG